MSEVEESNTKLQKKSNKFCTSRKCFYLCSPKQNGIIKTGERRDARSDTKTERFTIPHKRERKYKPAPGRERRTVL